MTQSQYGWNLATSWNVGNFLTKWETSSFARNILLNGVVKVFCSWTKLAQNQAYCYVKILCSDKKRETCFISETAKRNAFATDKRHLHDSKVRAKRAWNPVSVQSLQNVHVFSTHNTSPWTVMFTQDVYRINVWGNVFFLLKSEPTRQGCTKYFVRGNGNWQTDTVSEFSGVFLGLWFNLYRFSKGLDCTMLQVDCASLSLLSSLFNNYVTWKMVGNQTQPCRMKCINGYMMNSYMFRPVLAIFRLS
jgi:hypothetical protein